MKKLNKTSVWTIIMMIVVGVVGFVGSLMYLLVRCIYNWIVNL